MNDTELILTDKKTREVWTFPVLPESFKVSYANRLASYDIIRVGEIKVQDGLELSGIEWESFFPGPSLKDNIYVDSWRDPMNYNDWLERVKIEDRIVTVMLTGPNPVCFDCHLESYDPERKGGLGSIYYTVKWIQAKDLKIWYDGLDNISPETGSVTYRSHVQNVGWQTSVLDGDTSGTTGKSLRLEAIEVKTFIDGLSVKYAAHVQNIGWQDYVYDGATAGTTGQSLRLEAVRIMLKGKYASQYDIYYRLHVANSGWKEWKNNDQTSGNPGISLRAEAIQIFICKSGQFYLKDNLIPSDISSDSAVTDTSRPTGIQIGTAAIGVTTKPGDTLWDLAFKYLKDGNKWRDIYELNKTVIGDDPMTLESGLVIQIC